MTQDFLALIHSKYFEQIDCCFDDTHINPADGYLRGAFEGKQHINRRKEKAV